MSSGPGPRGDSKEFTPSRSVPSSSPFLTNDPLQLSLPNPSQIDLDRLPSASLMRRPSSRTAKSIQNSPEDPSPAGNIPPGSLVTSAPKDMFAITFNFQGSPFDSDSNVDVVSPPMPEPPAPSPASTQASPIEDLKLSVHTGPKSRVASPEEEFTPVTSPYALPRPSLPRAGTSRSSRSTRLTKTPGPAPVPSSTPILGSFTARTPFAPENTNADAPPALATELAVFSQLTVSSKASSMVSATGTGAGAMSSTGINTGSPAPSGLTTSLAAAKALAAAASPATTTAYTAAASAAVAPAKSAAANTSIHSGTGTSSNSNLNVATATPSKAMIMSTGASRGAGTGPMSPIALASPRLGRSISLTPAAGAVGTGTGTGTGTSGTGGVGMSGGLSRLGLDASDLLHSGAQPEYGTLGHRAPIEAGTATSNDNGYGVGGSERGQRTTHSNANVAIMGMGMNTSVNRPGTDVSGPSLAHVTLQMPSEGMQPFSEDLENSRFRMEQPSRPQDAPFRPFGESRNPADVGQYATIGGFNGADADYEGLRRGGHRSGILKSTREPVLNFSHEPGFPDFDHDREIPRVQGFNPDDDGASVGSYQSYQSYDSYASYATNDSYAQLAPLRPKMTLFGRGEEWETASFIERIEDPRLRRQRLVRQKKLLLVALLRALVRYGATTHRVEYLVHKVAEGLKLRCNAMVLPNMFLLTFGDKDRLNDPTKCTTVALALSGGLDAYKLQETEVLAQCIARLRYAKKDKEDTGKTAKEDEKEQEKRVKKEERGRDKHMYHEYVTKKDEGVDAEDDLEAVEAAIAKKLRMGGYAVGDDNSNANGQVSAYVTLRPAAMLNSNPNGNSFINSGNLNIPLNFENMDIPGKSSGVFSGVDGNSAMYGGQEYGYGYGNALDSGRGYDVDAPVTDVTATGAYRGMGTSAGAATGVGKKEKHVNYGDAYDDKEDEYDDRNDKHAGKTDDRPTYTRTKSLGNSTTSGNGGRTGDGNNAGTGTGSGSVKSGSGSIRGGSTATVNRARAGNGTGNDAGSDNGMDTNALNTSAQRLPALTTLTRGTAVPYHPLPPPPALSHPATPPLTGLATPTGAPASRSSLAANVASVAAADDNDEDMDASAQPLPPPPAPPVPMSTMSTANPAFFPAHTHTQAPMVMQVQPQGQTQVADMGMGMFYDPNTQTLMQQPFPGQMSGMPIGTPEQMQNLPMGFSQFPYYSQFPMQMQMTQPMAFPGQVTAVPMQMWPPQQQQQQTQQAQTQQQQQGFLQHLQAPESKLPAPSVPAEFSQMQPSAMYAASMPALAPTAKGATVNIQQGQGNGNGTRNGTRNGINGTGVGVGVSDENRNAHGGMVMTANDNGKSNGNGDASGNGARTLHIDHDPEEEPPLEGAVLRLLAHRDGERMSHDDNNYNPVDRNYNYDDKMYNYDRTIYGAGGMGEYGLPNDYNYNYNANINYNAYNNANDPNYNYNFPMADDMMPASAADYAVQARLTAAQQAQGRNIGKGGFDNENSNALPHTHIHTHAHGHGHAPRPQKRMKKFQMDLPTPLQTFFNCRKPTYEFEPDRPFEMRAALHRIVAQPGLYSLEVQTLMIIVASTCCASLFFNGSANDVLVAFLLSLIVAAFYYLSSFIALLGPLQSMMCSLFVSFVAHVIRRYWFPQTCMYPVMLGALIWLLPGWSITTAVIELASRSMISGTVRFINAIFTTLQMGFGLAVGSRLVFWTSVDITAPCLGPLPGAWKILTFPAMSIAMNILLGGHPRQWPGMVSAAAIAMFGSVWLSEVIPPDLVNMTTAFLIGVWSNIIGYCTSEQPIVYLLGGILLLVPGSISVKGATAMFNKNGVEMLEFFNTMFQTTISICVGLLVAKLLFPHITIGGGGPSRTSRAKAAPQTGYMGGDIVAFTTPDPILQETVHVPRASQRERETQAVPTAASVFAPYQDPSASAMASPALAVPPSSRDKEGMSSPGAAGEDDNNGARGGHTHVLEDANGRPVPRPHGFTFDREGYVAELSRTGRPRALSNPRTRTVLQQRTPPMYRLASGGTATSTGVGTGAGMGGSGLGASGIRLHVSGASRVMSGTNTGAGTGSGGVSRVLSGGNLGMGYRTSSRPGSETDLARLAMGPPTPFSPASPFSSEFEDLQSPVVREKESVRGSMVFSPRAAQPSHFTSPAQHSHARHTPQHTSVQHTATPQHASTSASAETAMHATHAVQATQRRATPKHTPQLAASNTPKLTPVFPSTAVVPPTALPTTTLPPTAVTNAVNATGAAADVGAGVSGAVTTSPLGTTTTGAGMGPSTAVGTATTTSVDAAAAMLSTDLAALQTELSTLQSDLLGLSTAAVPPVGLPNTPNLAAVPLHPTPGLLALPNTPNMLGFPGTPGLMAMPMPATPGMLPMTATPGMIPLAGTPGMLAMPSTPGMLPLSAGAQGMVPLAGAQGLMALPAGAMGTAPTGDATSATMMPSTTDAMGMQTMPGALPLGMPAPMGMGLVAGTDMALGAGMGIAMDVEKGMAALPPPSSFVLPVAAAGDAASPAAGASIDINANTTSTTTAAAAPPPSSSLVPPLVSPGIHLHTTDTHTGFPELFSPHNDMDHLSAPVALFSPVARPEHEHADTASVTSIPDRVARDSPALKPFNAELTRAVRDAQAADTTLNAAVNANIAAADSTASAGPNAVMTKAEAGTGVGVDVDARPSSASLHAEFDPLHQTSQTQTHTSPPTSTSTYTQAQTQVSTHVPVPSSIATATPILTSLRALTDDISPLVSTRNASPRTAATHISPFVAPRSAYDVDGSGKVGMGASMNGAVASSGDLTATPLLGALGGGMTSTNANNLNMSITTANADIAGAGGDGFVPGAASLPALSATGDRYISPIMQTQQQQQQQQSAMMGLGTGMSAGMGVSNQAQPAMVMQMAHPMAMGMVSPQQQQHMQMPLGQQMMYMRTPTGMVAVPMYQQPPMQMQMMYQPQPQQQYQPQQQQQGVSRAVPIPIASAQRPPAAASVQPAMSSSLRQPGSLPVVMRTDGTRTPAMPMSVPNMGMGTSMPTGMNVGMGTPIGTPQGQAMLSMPITVPTGAGMGAAMTMGMKRAASGLHIPGMTAPVPNIGMAMGGLGGVGMDGMSLASGPVMPSAAPRRPGMPQAGSYRALDAMASLAEEEDGLDDAASRGVDGEGEDEDEEGIEGPDVECPGMDQFV